HKQRGQPGAELFPHAFQLLRLGLFTIDLQAGSIGDLLDDSLKSLVGVDPKHTSRIASTESVDVLGCGLAFTESSHSRDDANALNYRCLTSIKLVVYLPQRVDAANKSVS